MGRRRKDGVAEDFVEIVARLPWWGGVVLAVIFYVVLHRLAVPPKVAVGTGQVANLMTGTLVAGLATVGQYLVPLLCLVAALISFAGRRKREGLVASVASSRSPDALHGMSWREFELLVGEAFRLQGYAVQEVGGAGPDGGVDLVLRRGSEIALVQCKQWKATQVGVQVVRELYGVMAARGATAGFVVTSGTFSDDAREFAQGRNISLVDGRKLFGLIQQARSSLRSRAAPVPPRQPQLLGVRPERQPDMQTSVPDCPKCSAPMVRRTARKGANAGAQFWGCSNFPRCHGTR